MLASKIRILFAVTMAALTFSSTGVATAQPNSGGSAGQAKGCTLRIGNLNVSYNDGDTITITDNHGDKNKYKCINGHWYWQLGRIQSESVAVNANGMAYLTQGGKARRVGLIRRFDGTLVIVQSAHQPARPG